MNLKAVRLFSYAGMLGVFGFAGYNMLSVDLIGQLTGQSDPREVKLKAGPVRYAIGEVTEVQTRRGGRKQLPVQTRVFYKFTARGVTYTGEDGSFILIGPKAGDKILVRFKGDEPVFNRYDARYSGSASQPAGGWEAPPED